jgi:hypothetical protein
MKVYSSTFFPDARTPWEAVTLTLSAGDELTNIDLQLSEVDTGSVSGTALGPEGPIAGGLVRLMPHKGTHVTVSPVLDYATGLTDSTGKFILLGVAPGNYHLGIQVRPSVPPRLLSIRQDGDVKRQTVRFAQPPPTADLYWGLTTIRVGQDENIESVELRLTRGAHVSGRIQFADSLTHPPGVRFDKIRINVEDVETGSSVVSIPVDQNGGFFSSSLAPGSYLLTVAGGVTGWVLEAILRGSDDVSLTPFQTGALDVEGIVVRLTTRVTGITGTVRNAKGGLVQSGTVLIFPRDSRTWEQPAVLRRQVSALPVSVNGSFFSNPLPPGDYLVAAIEAGAFDTEWSHPGVLAKLASAAATVTVRRGAIARLDLRPVAVPR